MRVHGEKARAEGEGELMPERPPIRARFRAILMEAQRERHLRPDLVTLPSGGVECEWAAFERGVMHREINRVRAEHGLPDVTAEAVVTREAWACGHVDYTVKFALYCAELAVGHGEQGI